MSELLPLFVVVPLAAGFLSPLGRACTGDRGIRAVRGLALLVGALLLLGSVVLLGRGPVMYWIGRWPAPGRPTVGLSLVADGLTQLLLVTVNGIALLALL